MEVNVIDKKDEKESNKVVVNKNDQPYTLGDLLKDKGIKINV